jgi:hypothetical protein
VGPHALIEALTWFRWELPVFSVSIPVLADERECSVARVALGETIRRIASGAFRWVRIGQPSFLVLRANAKAGISMCENMPRNSMGEDARKCAF